MATPRTNIVKTGSSIGVALLLPGGGGGALNATNEVRFKDKTIRSRFILIKDI